MSKIISQVEFVRRYAKRAGIMQKDAKKYLAIMFGDITGSLARGSEFRIGGIGTIKRVKFPSKTMANPNDRSQQMLVLDRYYARFKATSNFKLKLKAQLFPDRYSLPQPKYKPPQTPEGALKISVGRSHAVPIKVRPTIPPVSWRKPMSSLILDLRAERPDIKTRLLRNLLRQAALEKTTGVSISPYEISNYGAPCGTDKISPQLYKTTIDALRDRLPFAFSTPGSWRLLTHLPGDSSSRNLFNFSALPSTEDDWLVQFSQPRARGVFDGKIDKGSMVMSKKALNETIARGRGHLAIIGPHSGRRAILNQIREDFEKNNVNHHYCIEHHRFDNYDNHPLTPSLRSLRSDISTHPITIIDELSAADNLFHLRHFPGVTISSIFAPNKEYFDRLCALQHIPINFFDAIIEGDIIQSVCPLCMGEKAPAVRYPLLRRLAGARGELLHVHTVRLSDKCEHSPHHHLVDTVYKNDGTLGPSFEEQFYRKVLDNKISYNTLVNHLGDK